MAFQVSPGVLVQERDLTRIIPAVSTSIGAVAGEFRKGPLEEIVAISSEAELVDTFGEPDSNNFEAFFSAANFLQYSNALRVVRATTTSLVNATTTGCGLQIKNTTHYQDNYADGSGVVGNFAARTAGAWGNNLLVSTCPTATAYEEEGATTVNDSSTAVGDTTIVVTDGTALNVGDIISFSTTAATNDYDDGKQYRITGISTHTLTIVQKEAGSGGLETTITDGANVRRRWRYYDSVDRAPGTSAYVSDRSGSGDELHVVVVDEDGGITGVPGDVIETFSSMSKAADAKTPQGDTNYYPDVIYAKSNFIYWMDHNTSGTNWGNNAAGTTYTAVDTPTLESLSGGSDGSSVTNAQKLTAYERFEDPDTVDVGLIIAGSGDGTHIDNLVTVAEKRKDAIVFASPERADVVNVSNSHTQTGDVAGLCARADAVADSWFSPAGFNRGIVRGAVKLAYNPTKAQRDILYPARINPVVTLPGTGTVLFGDKTALTTPSAFDRINVRRLFITLEKAISTAAKFQLFEFNDEFTRANFRNIVEPFLRDVQGRRGITDFLVVCDDTNNPGSVIDRNEFVAEIFIKPARSINFITLKFVATRTGVAFEEVAG